MRKGFLLAVVIIALTSSVHGQLCGPYLIVTSVTDSDWGLTNATLKYWDCDGVQWMSISGSTSGGNGSYLLVSQTTLMGVTTREYQNYYADDEIERTPGIILEQQEVIEIFVIDSDENYFYLEI